MDAEDWLRTVERELHTAQCDDSEKVLYGPHLLRGAAQSVLEISEDAHLFSAVGEFYTLFLCCKLCQISSDVWLHSADVREQA